MTRRIMLFKLVRCSIGDMLDIIDRHVPRPAEHSTRSSRRVISRRATLSPNWISPSMNFFMH